MDATRRRDFSILIGEVGADYYLNAFERIEKGWPLAPNIYAGIFGVLWLLRRRLLLGAVLIYIPLMALSYLLLHAYFDTFKGLSDNWPMLFVLPHVALFLGGNNIYYLRCRRMMMWQDIQDGDFGQGQRVPALMWRGGTMPGMPMLVYSLIFAWMHFSFIFWFVKSPYYFSVVGSWVEVLWAVFLDILAGR